MIFVTYAARSALLQRPFSDPACFSPNQHYRFYSLAERGENIDPPDRRSSGFRLR